MRTCEEYVVDKLEKLEHKTEWLEENYNAMKRMHDYRVEDIQFLLKFFKKTTTSDGHPYYTMTDLVMEQFDPQAYSGITDLIERFGKDKEVEAF